MENGGIKWWFDLRFLLFMVFVSVFLTCVRVFLVHKGVQLSVRVGCLEVSRSPGVCLRRRSGRTPRLAKLQQTGRWLLGKLPNKAPIAGTTKTLGQYLCVYIDIYIYMIYPYIYIYLHANVCGKHISFTRHDTRLGKRFASKKAVWYSTILQGKCVFFHIPNKGSAVDGRCPLKTFFIIACCKAESNWVFDIYKTKGVYRFSLDLLLPNPRLPKQLVFCGPFFLVAGRIRFTSLVPKAFPKSKSSRFLRRGRWSKAMGIVEARNETQKWLYPPKV